MDPTKGLFRRRPSSASTNSRFRASSSNSSATLSVHSGTSITAQSCPTSPKHSPQPRRSMGGERIPEDEEAYQQQPATTSTEAAEYAAAIEDARREQQQRQHVQLQKSQSRPQMQMQKSSSRQNVRAAGNGSSVSGSSTARVSSAGSRLMRAEENRQTASTTTTTATDAATSASKANGSAQLQRSASTVSGFGVRPRSSPAGLHAYTAGSVPSSVHGSRVDLRDTDKGSAIYLGCSGPRASTLSIASSRGSSAGSAPPSPVNTPPASPRHGIKRSTSLVKKPR